MDIFCPIPYPNYENLVLEEAVKGDRREGVAFTLDRFFKNKEALLKDREWGQQQHIGISFTIKSDYERHAMMAYF